MHTPVHDSDYTTSMNLSVFHDSLYITYEELLLLILNIWETSADSQKKNEFPHSYVYSVKTDSLSSAVNIAELVTRPFLLYVSTVYPDDEPSGES